MSCPNHPQWLHDRADCPYCGITCNCVVKNRQDGETQREWLKRWMCQFHWMCTDYYQNKLPKNERTWDAVELDRRS